MAKSLVPHLPFRIMDRDEGLLHSISFSIQNKDIVPFDVRAEKQIPIVNKFALVLREYHICSTFDDLWNWQKISFDRRDE